MPFVAGGLTDAEARAVSGILLAIESGAASLARALSSGPLSGLTGSAGLVNVQGEEVQAFDEIAQEIFSRVLRESEAVSLLVSEERDVPENLEGVLDGAFHMAMDPLDGSSNLAVSGPVGSIFAIYRPDRSVPGTAPSDDFLRSVPGLVAAVYVLYSVSTILAVTFGTEVRTYALDPDSSRFLPLPGPVRFPPGGGQIVSLNSGNCARWSPEVRRYADAVLSEKSRSARYVGALVMDFHRNLLKGGIYLYPADMPKDGLAGALPEGKLRLLYEAIPMALIARAAGGLATDGRTPILSIAAKGIHQRVPLVVGSRELVLEFCKIAGVPEPV